MTRTKYSFWSAGLDEEYYIVKQKKGSAKLTEINVLHDHIANSIYQIFGVSTPGLYIGYYQKQLSLISSVLPGYKNLIEWFNDENALEEINQYQLPIDNKKLYLEHLANLVLRKKSSLKKALNLPEIQVTSPELAPIFIKNIVLSEPLEYIDQGSSNPCKVKRIIPAKSPPTDPVNTQLAL
jgi:hypothetical protein